MSLFDLTGKRALVTGASRGIGQACAQALGNAGAHVTLTARASKDLDDATASVGRNATALPLDVTDLAAMRAALARLPAFDILVANAGINIPMPFVDVTENTYDTIFDLNVRATFFLCQEVVRKMIGANIAGSIIIMSSQLGQVGFPGRTPYCASKHAVEGLAKTMALDLAAKGIRVNTVAPGLVQTPLVSKILNTPEMLAGAVKTVPLNRLCQPEDIAGAIVYLASAAAIHVTGTCLRIDGGVTAQ
jgi:NAD(P)-dependent dehydrogenase (short-subunit alcohol dehydrogenase family)